jgi:hypothetical protein
MMMRGGGLGVQPRRKRKKTGFYCGALSMRTTFTVITAFNVGSFFAFLATKTHVIVHLSPKVTAL